MVVVVVILFALASYNKCSMRAFNITNVCVQYNQFDVQTTATIIYNNVCHAPTSTTRISDKLGLSHLFTCQATQLQYVAEAAFIAQKADIFASARGHRQLGR